MGDLGVISIVYPIFEHIGCVLMMRKLQLASSCRRRVQGMKCNCNQTTSGSRYYC